MPKHEIDLSNPLVLSYDPKFGSYQFFFCHTCGVIVWDVEAHDRWANTVQTTTAMVTTSQIEDAVPVVALPERPPPEGYPAGTAVSFKANTFQVRGFVIRSLWQGDIPALEIQGPVERYIIPMVKVSLA